MLRARLLLSQYSTAMLSHLSLPIHPESVSPKIFPSTIGPLSDPWESYTGKRRPGVQVVISAHNAEPWLARCLASVDLALAGYSWILVFADDGSSDDTLRIATNFPTSASKVILRSYPKAANVSIAKNRAFALALRHRTEFPAIVPMDADDVMPQARVRHLLEGAMKHGAMAVMGDYQYHCPDIPSKHLRIVKADPGNIDLGVFGPPMTLFHSSLIPGDGRLFREEMEAYSDCALWHEWRSRGIEFVSLPGKVIHHYHYRDNSTSNPENEKLRDQRVDAYLKVRDQILDGTENPASEPLVSALMITGLGGSRINLAKLSLECFEAQTWEDKELIIINHGSTPISNGQKGVREFFVSKESGTTLGDLRNISLEKASGEYVIQWDDDDYHHPAQITEMMRHRSKAEVVLLSCQIRASLERGSAYYRSVEGGQHMAFLHRREIPYRYPSFERREDTVFLNQFNSRYVIQNEPGSLPGPELYIRFFHGENVWDEQHIMEHLAGRDEVLEVEDKDINLLTAVINDYRDSLGIHRVKPSSAA